VEAELFHEDRRTDMELIVNFSQFCDHPERGTESSSFYIVEPVFWHAFVT